MVVAKLILGLVALTAVVTALVGGVVWLFYRRAQWRHERRMRREERDHETIMEYAENDALSDDE